MRGRTSAGKSSIQRAPRFAVGNPGMVERAGWRLDRMTVWGKIIGSVAGFAVGGPIGAVVGAALGHAADSGGLGAIPGPFSPQVGLGAARMAALLGRRDQLFAIAVVVLAAKLAKCDGPVVRAEIDAFRRGFRIPPQSVHDIGHLFDRARDSAEGFEEYAAQLGESFADNRGTLEDVLAALFSIARADGPINRAEQQFLQTVCHRFGLGAEAWERARDGRPRQYVRATDDDPYAILGAPRTATDEELRSAWVRLMRENHPDSLASRGVTAEFMARASEKVAEINAAWDRIKRERRL
jgi:DnaJ like chaperone protein